MEDSYVKIMNCRFCGQQTNGLAIHKRLQNIKGEVYDTEPCEDCKKRFTEFKYFIGVDCGHSGFIKITALKNLLLPEYFDTVKSHNNAISLQALLEPNSPSIFKIEKCFSCMGFIKLEDCPKI